MYGTGNSSLTLKQNSMKKNEVWRLDASTAPGCKVTELIIADGRIVGVKCSCPMESHPVRHWHSFGAVTGFEAVMDDSSSGTEVKWNEKFESNYEDNVEDVIKM